VSTRGKLRFLADDSPPPVYKPSVGGAEARLDLAGEFVEREVELADGRTLSESFQLDRQGFEFLSHETAVADVYDVRERSGRYERECRELVSAATGAARTYCFDHTLRSADSVRRDEKKIREPTAVIHNDYTPRSGPQRVRDLVPDEAEALLENRFAIVNVWRPLKPVESYPLVVCDARSLDAEDLVAAERRAANRIGELYMVRFSASQRWIYFPGMLPSEVLLIKTYDSSDDGRARWCVHTALDDRMERPSAAARESIETRVFAFFDA
jgi:hypothetical protein